MFRLSKLRVLALIVLLTPAFARGDDKPQNAADKLAAGIKLYESADYEGAKDLLLEINEADLKADDQKVQLQRYLGMAEKAITEQARAEQNYDDAEAAMKDKKYETAKPLFESVLANKFAAEELKGRSTTYLKEITDKLNPVQASPLPVQIQPAPQPAAQPVIQQVAPSEPIIVRQSTPPPAGGSILEDVAEEHALLWQQAVTSYRDAESKLRKAVMAEDFEEAHRQLDFAREVIELNRRYASPPSAYDDMIGQAKELESFLGNEEREYEERLIREKHIELEQREAARVQQITVQKERQIEQLMDQATELRKEQRLDEAIQVLKQVLALDPNNQQAIWTKETLEDLSSIRTDIQAGKDMGSQSQDVLVQTDEAAIPWHADIQYPKNWREISARRTGAEEAADSESNRIIRRKLQNVAPEIRFEAQPFDKVLEQLRALTGLNIVANWTALESAGVERDGEVNLPPIQNVKYEKALQLVLDAVGAGETELAFQIDDGVITVSTKEDLSRKTITRVYNVQDLIITVPTFRGRQINLDQIGQNSQQQGGLGGGRFLQGTGGGGGGGGGGNIFGGGGQQNDEEQLAQGQDPLQPIIQLIQQTIDPESWRESGGNVGAIQALNQQIIVTQTSTAHNELRDLLRQLRQSRALQIAVEARYITISRNWLEQIGVDLDLVLNSGNAGFDRTTIIDPATNNPVLVPRQFTRNGFTPGAPGGVGIPLPTQPFGQPYGQPGLVPAVGSVGPHSSSWTPIPIINNTLDLASPADTNIPGSLGSLANSTPAFQMFGSFLDNLQVDFLLRATQVDKRSSDLDAPRLVLFNGQRATFEKFIEQDYIAALTPIIGDNAGAFLPNVATALTGRSLDVQATVSADRRYVTMTVRTFTRVTGDFRTVFFGGSQTVGSGFIELATQTTQQIRTTVSVPDGGTLLIGGLKLAAERDIDAGVPILSRIPILKRAFSNTSNVKDDQVLLILIKPTIIIQEEAEAEAFPSLNSSTPP